ncbi:hypothetical protein [Nonomuraea sp. NPDC049400]|uniref:hypothetical protein n=1 Tax=Nonomuraea sp. NPDC049400 TaxID=3364352 RepID=UPI00378F495F
MESDPDFRLPLSAPLKWPQKPVGYHKADLREGDTMALVEQTDWNGTEIPFTSNHSADAGRG